jgi:peptide/nickel transport system substrate-binding protein
MIKAVLCAVVVGAGITLLSGNATAQAPKRGGILNFAVVAEPPTYDCHANNTFALIHPIAPHLLAARQVRR